MDELIHYTDWGAQGDNKIACTQTWHAVDISFSGGDEIRKSMDGLYYSPNGDRVNCSHCLEILEEKKKKYLREKE